MKPSPISLLLLLSAWWLYPLPAPAQERQPLPAKNCRPSCPPPPRGRSRSNIRARPRTPRRRHSGATDPADREPVWQARPTGSHLSEDRKTLRFEQLHQLQPDTPYSVLISRNAFRIGDRPAGPINDGAYWWRFRTKAE